MNDPAHLPEYTREQISFVDPANKLPSAILNMLRRCHVNLGHPSGPDMVRYLAICGAQAETLMGARGFRCTVAGIMV